MYQTGVNILARDDDRRKNVTPKLINNLGGLLRRNNPSNIRRGIFRTGVTHMRTKIGAFAAVAGLTLALGTLSSTAHAAITKIIIDTDSDAAVGSITFPTFAGDSAAGLAFSYDGFTQADITSISWTLDPTTEAVVALDLNALQGDNPCPNGAMDCSNRTASLSPTFATFGSASCSFSPDTGMCRESVEFADLTFVPVPEPSTWAMMVVGFVGLGVAGYRLNRQAAGGTDSASLKASDRIATQRLRDDEGVGGSHSADCRLKVTLLFPSPLGEGGRADGAAG